MNRHQMQAELADIVRELETIRRAALAIAMEDLTDEQAAKLLSLFESHDPIVGAVQAIRIKLDRIEQRIKAAQH